MKTPNGIDPNLLDHLDELKSVPARDPETAALGKARFLAEAASMRAARTSRLQPQKVQPRRFAMNAIAAVVVTLLLFFGGSVGAAYAAQEALPGAALYTLKLWIEDTRLDLASTPEAGIDLLMQFVQVRVTEMNELAEQGVTPPSETQERLEQQVRTALDLAAGIPDDVEMQAALLRIRTQLEAQSQALTDETMEPVRTMLQAQLQRVDEGLADPAAFRNTVRNEEQAGETATQSPGPQATPAPDITPTGESSGNGSTPTPGGGQSPTTGPHNPLNTPGPTQEPGGNSNGGGQGGKP